jgi:adenylate kinase family enzyme
VTARRIHFVGASGSGTTTLAAALAQRLDVRHYDTDSYFWYPTDPPFEKIRSQDERYALMDPDLAHDAWTLSGSLCGWGDVYIPRFDLVVFCAVPERVREARLRARERRRYGDAIDRTLREKSEAFIAWAMSYEAGPTTQRSRIRHEAWLATLPCPVLRLEDMDDVATRLEEVMAACR